MRNALGDVRSVLVLGGGSDIGAAVADAFVDRGARSIVLAARETSALAAQTQRLRTAGCRVHCLPFDATRPETHADVVAAAVAESGDLDVVLLAFGVLGDGGLGTANALEVAAVNYSGALTAALAAVDRLVSQGHGTIVVLSSVAAERARASTAVYASSKAGLDTFAQGLGDALAPTGVKVLVVRPGFVHTKMTAGLRPAPFATTPDRVAHAVVRALERGAETVWVPSGLRWIMLGLRVLPRPLFRRLPF